MSTLIFNGSNRLKAMSNAAKGRELNNLYFITIVKTEDNKYLVTRTVRFVNEEKDKKSTALLGTIDLVIKWLVPPEVVSGRHSMPPLLSSAISALFKYEETVATGELFETIITDGGE